MICSRQEDIHPKQWDSKKEFPRGLSVLVEERIYWRIIVMNFNYLLYYCIIAQYFPEVKVSVHTTCSLKTTSFPPSHSWRQEASSKKLLRHHRDEWLPWNAATFRIKHNTAKERTERVKAKRWVTQNFGKQGQSFCRHGSLFLQYCLAFLQAN